MRQWGAIRIRAVARALVLFAAVAPVALAAGCADRREGPEAGRAAGDAASAARPSPTPAAPSGAGSPAGAGGVGGVGATTSTAVPPATAAADAGVAAGPAAIPPYSFDDSVPPPPLVLTGDDFEAIWRSIDAYLHWIWAHRPDHELLDRAIYPYSTATQLYGGMVTELVDSNLRMYDTASVVTKVEVTSRRLDLRPPSVSLRVTYTDDRRIWVRPDGTVARAVELPSPQDILIFLQQRGDGTWRPVGEYQVPTGPPPAVML